MKKLFTLLSGVALALSGAAPAMAANVDQAQGEINGVTWIYWNEHQDNGNYYPNWRFEYAEDSEFSHAEGDTRTSVLTYTLTRGGEVVSQGNGGQTNWLPTFSTFYVGLGILEDGEYTMTSTWKVGDNEIEVPAQTFTVTGNTDLPAVAIDYTITDNVFDYTLTFENIEESDIASIEVYLEQVGGVRDSSDTKSGSITVTIPAGATQATAWMHVNVTLNNGTVLHPSNNNANFNFKAPASEDNVEITLAVSNPVALTDTTGTLDYTLTCSNVDKVENFTIYVVTNGDREVSDQIVTNELTGVINLKDLNNKAITELWVKAYATLTDGTTTETVQFPGAAQGWTGLSIDTTVSLSVDAIEMAAEGETSYYTLQGVKVATPSQGGIYIVVKNGKYSKIFVK